MREALKGVFLDGVRDALLSPDHELDAHPVTTQSGLSDLRSERGRAVIVLFLSLQRCPDGREHSCDSVPPSPLLTLLSPQTLLAV